MILHRTIEVPDDETEEPKTAVSMAAHCLNESRTHSLLLLTPVWWASTFTLKSFQIKDTWMRDPGLEEAVRAVGGVSALARQIGISQPSVSNWTRIPAERVLTVEAATGVDRKVLRPDLYGAAERARDVDDVAARGRRNTRCSPRCSPAPPTPSCWRVSPACAATPRRSASPMPRSRRPRAKPPSNASSASIFNLFIGLGRGELLPYGSSYLTGFLHERPLARLRADLGPLGIERAEGNASLKIMPRLCEIMAGIVSGRLPAPQGTDSRFSRSICRPGSADSSPTGRRSRRSLSPDRNTRPGVHGNRNGSFALPS